MVIDRLGLRRYQLLVLMSGLINADMATLGASHDSPMSVIEPMQMLHSCGQGH